MSDKPQPLPTLGQYELLEELGAGGMGRVYKAQHCHLGKIVAVKVLSEEFSSDPRDVARFRREMKAVGALNHPNIVRATDAGQSGKTHFLVMDYEDGIDLQKLLEAHGKLPLVLACEFVRQACDALEYARQRGRVHRDIKPGNLMVCRDRRVKVLDFGLARLLQQESSPQNAEGPISQEGQVLGTPDYLSPEQATGKRELDIRSDIYSLGCTFYALLAGRPPFEGANDRGPIGKMWAHVKQEAPPIETFVPELPAEIAGLIRGMMAKKPEDRYQTPGEVGFLLQSFLKGKLPQWQAIASFLPGFERGEGFQFEGPQTLALHPPRAQTEVVHARQVARAKPTRPGFRSELSVGAVVGPACKLEKLISQSGTDELWQASGGRDSSQSISLLIRDLSGQSADSVNLSLLSLLRQNLRHPHLQTLRAFWLLDADLKPINKNMHVLLESGQARKLVMGGRACSQTLLEAMATHCEAGQPMPLSRILSALEQLAEAFDHLNTPEHQIDDHSVAFVHSNLHPVNVLYQEEHGYRLANFSHLRALTGNWAPLTQVGPIPPCCLQAPEIRDGRLTIRSDQYSLALLYLWMRSGLPPWEETQVQERLLAHLKHPQASLAAIASAEQTPLLRALSTDPGTRFASCGEFVSALKAVVGSAG